MFGFSPMGVNAFAEARQNGFFTALTNLAEAVYSTGQASIGTTRYPRLAIAEGFLPTNGYDVINFGVHNNVSVITYALSWRYVVPAGDTITSASVVVSPADVAASNVVISGTTLSWQIGAGCVLGNTYSISCTIGTLSGLSATRIGSFDALNQQI